MSNSVKMRKALQLQELLAREKFEYTIEKENTVLKYVDYCYVF